MTILLSQIKESGEESGSDSSFEEEPVPPNQAKKFKNNVSQSSSKSESEETKPKVDGGDDENIILTVSDPRGSTERYRIKKTTPFRKLMDAHCKKLGLSKCVVRFCFHGKRLFD